MLTNWLKSKLSLPLIAIAGLILAVSFIKQKPEMARVEQAKVSRKVWYIDVQEMPVKARAIGYGTVQPETTLAANAQVAGKVVYVHPGLKKGGSIDKGVKVLQIDTTDYELGISQAQANLAVYQANLKELDIEEKNTKTLLEIAKRNYEIGKSELERKNQLRKQQSVSQSVVDAEEQKVLALQEQFQSLQNTLSTSPSRRAVIEAQIAQASAQLKEQQKNLERTTITMPFRGRIGEVHVDLDEYVNVGTKLFDASSIGRVEIHAQLPMKHARPLVLGVDRSLLTQQPPSPQRILEALGLDVTVRLVGTLKKASWKAKAVRLGEEIDQTSRTVSFIVAVDSSYQKGIPGERPPLLKGMYTEVEFQSSAKQRIVVPRQAIHQGKAYIASQNNTLQIKPVKIEFYQGELIAIAEGVKPGDRLVTSDVIPAVEGMQLDLAHNEKLQEAMKLLASGKGDFK
ncbi:efflux RND transporter periplasmic adaptor subunit [Spartinivicinus ruber]|uniref:efflux RND transporter periplasmic adaptor subunit n=1 Tax=Spartinivicinus ruber TaxID=2683272 RepID=UPI0013D8BE92|nr:HlyD family secretion protein [Spartinivicinus ruber]